eukprot:5589614-Prymnesium_polylepis.1
MLAQVVKSATSYAVGVPRARLWPHAPPCALGRRLAPPPAAGRTDARRPARGPFASGSVAAAHAPPLLSIWRSRGPP